MDNGAVLIYKSRTGFTEQYAKWISEELKCDYYPYGKRFFIPFWAYDTIIFGSWMRMGSIGGVNWLRKKLPLWVNKRVVVFVTGLEPKDSPNIPKNLKKNFTLDEWRQIRLFYMRSGLNQEKLGLRDRALLKLFVRRVNNDPLAAKTAKALEKSCDYSDKEDIAALTEYCGKQPQKT